MVFKSLYQNPFIILTNVILVWSNFNNRLLIKSNLACKTIQKSYLSVALILLIFMYLQLYILFVISLCNFHFCVAKKAESFTG